jgi:4-amino-4-deoxy-L-arabinose transferase-like glycosyltransferase
LTVVAAAALGARLFGERTGALAALLLAAAPLHLAQGHYSTVDVPAALWTTLCLLLCAGALQAPARGALVAAGLCAGLAASTKYNAGLVLLAPLFTLAATWRREEWYASERAAALVFIPLAAAAAFLVTTPGLFIDTERFWAALRYELAHTGTGHGLVFINTTPAWLIHLSSSASSRPSCAAGL